MQIVNRVELFEFDRLLLNLKDIFEGLVHPFCIISANKEKAAFFLIITTSVLTSFLQIKIYQCLENILISKFSNKCLNST